MGHTTLSKLLSKLKPILKSIFLVGVIAILFFSQADGALAARSGGRMGEGLFALRVAPIAPRVAPMLLIGAMVEASAFPS